MSEAAILTLFSILWGVIQLGVAGILGWIAIELRYIRKSLETKVEKSDCDNHMCRHYAEIQNLWSETRKNSDRISKIEK